MQPYTTDTFYQKILHKLHRLLFLAALCAVVFPAIAFLCKKVENVNEATDVLYTVAGFSMMFSVYALMILEQQNIEKSLRDVEQMVEKS